jgi:8-oxo-dGTP pyrophosphatase MutT (NUDIX family)
MKPYIPKSKAVLYKNPWWKYCLDTVELPSGSIGEYHYVLTNGSSMIIPIEQDEHLLMVRQYRYTGNRDSIEFPCGGLKDGATYDGTARDELVEETGFIAGKIQAVGSFNPCNGLLDELCKVYIARELRYAGARPDETESMELVRLTSAEIDAMILNGTIWDGMTIAAWAIGKHYIAGNR